MNATDRAPVALRTFVLAVTGQSSMDLALAAFLVGWMGDFLADACARCVIDGINLGTVVTIAIPVSVLGLFVWRRLNQPQGTVDMTEHQPQGKAGLILLLSRLDPRARGTSEEVQERRRVVEEAAHRIALSDPTALAAQDFQPLMGTNLEPALRALEFHFAQGTLQRCWTIGTPEETDAQARVTPGSGWLAPVIERWFDHLHPGNKVKFAPCGDVPPRNYVQLGQAIDAIFRQGPLRPESVICDVTGGLKLASIGAAMACLQHGRTMQYMATDRDWKGEPVPRGEMVPVLVQFQPMLSFPRESATEQPG
jgi:hypothetical protein